MSVSQRPENSGVRKTRSHSALSLGSVPSQASVCGGSKRLSSLRGICSLRVGLSSGSFRALAPKRLPKVQRGSGREPGPAPWAQESRPCGGDRAGGWEDMQGASLLLLVSPLGVWTSGGVVEASGFPQVPKPSISPAHRSHRVLLPWATPGSQLLSLPQERGSLPPRGISGLRKHRVG